MEERRALAPPLHLPPAGLTPKHLARAWRAYCALPSTLPPGRLCQGPWGAPGSELGLGRLLLGSRAGGMAGIAPDKPHG